MRSKKGFELSLNMIITVVLALAFLGIALFLMRDWFNKIHIPVIKDCEFNPPTQDNPICIRSNIEMKRAEIYDVTVAVLNNGDEDIQATELPKVSCAKSLDGQDLSVQVSALGRALAVGDSADYLLVMKVPKNAARDKYSCSLSLGSMSEPFSITVK
jgi:hypothetical protein